MMLRIFLFLCLGVLGLVQGLASLRAQTPKTDSLQAMDTRPELIYVYDALCGWCFAFSPVMQQVEQTYGDRLNIRVVSGGLRTGTSVEPISSMAGYIQQAYKRVEEMSGVRFGEPFLNGTLKKGTMRLDSEPFARAMAIVRERKPEQALAFARLLHKLIYVDGVDPLTDAAYAPYAEQVGVPQGEFLAAMAEPHYRDLAQADFQLAQQLGATGFPALFVRLEGKLYRLANGYMNYNELQPTLEEVLHRAASPTR
jgi:putative protein-disulfide isomerase